MLQLLYTLHIFTSECMHRSGGGMFVGPEHPMFRARRDEEQSPFSGEGPQRLPR